jgi:hypothetical protein
MKHYQETTKTINKLIKTTCDICGNEIKKYTGSTVDDVEISHRIGKQYPENDDTEYYNPDICGDCFESKIVPFLEGLGVTKDYEDYEKW